MHLENFPNLTSVNFSITSEKTWAYNCIAWSLGQTDVWWSTAPGGYYWPRRKVPKPMTIVANVIKLYENEGFVVCDYTTNETGVEKVALYATNGSFQHVALQKENGRWTSKLAEHEDIEHDAPESLLGGEYESIVCVLKRDRMRT